MADSTSLESNFYFNKLVLPSINDSTTSTACHAGETAAVRVMEYSHVD